MMHEERKQIVSASRAEEGVHGYVLASLSICLPVVYGFVAADFAVLLLLEGIKALNFRHDVS